MAIASAGRGPHGDKNCVTVFYRIAQIGRKGQPFRINIAFDQIGEPRLENRHDILVEVRYFVFIFVDANHIMAEISETGARNEANIARTYHCNFH